MRLFKLAHNLEAVGSIPTPATKDLSASHSTGFFVLKITLFHRPGGCAEKRLADRVREEGSCGGYAHSHSFSVKRVHYT